jgi:hypothetical protein
MEDNVDPCWRKSSYSGNGGGDCVEVAGQASRVLVRDTKQDGAGPALRFTPAAWRRFAGQVKRSLASVSVPCELVQFPGEFSTGCPIGRLARTAASPAW